MKRIFTISKVLPAIIFLQFVSLSFVSAQQNTFQCQATTWLGNKYAAVSFTFDDGPLCQFQTGLNLLNNFGFRGTYYIITNYIDSNLNGVNWDTVRKAASFGNEIASHTVNHADLSTLTNTAVKQDSLRMELGHSKQRIETEIPNKQCLSLAYPWTKYNDTVRYIAANYYLSGRSAGFPEYKTPPNFFSLAGTVIWTATTANDLNYYLNYCISRGDWFIEMIHGIDQGGWQPVPHATYYNHFSFVKARENIVWVAPVQEIIKYIRERQNLVFTNKQFVRDTISFNVSDNLNDSIYNSPVTVKVTPPACFTQIDSVMQNNTRISFQYVPYSLTGEIFFDVYPDSSKIRIFGTAALLPKPIIKFKGDSTFCEGDSAVLIGTDHMKKYIWSNNDDTLERIVVRTTETVSLTLIDQNGCHTKPSDTLHIVVYPLPPKPEVLSSKSFNLCEGDTAILRTAISYHKYLWSSGSVDSVITASKSRNFSVTVTDTNHCVNHSNVEVLKVNPLPSAPVITMISKQSFCTGDSLKLFAPAGFKKYLWSTGDTQQILTVRESKEIPFSVMVIDKNNCLSPISNVVFLPNNFSKFKPYVRLTGKPTFCEGDSAILTVIEDKYRFNWNTKEVSKSIVIRKSGNYSVTCVNEYNCKSEPSEVIEINSYSLPEKPTILYSGSTNLCEGDSIYLFAHRGPYDYKWSNGEHGSVINIKTPGIFSVIITNENGCKSSASDDILVLFSPKPEKPGIVQVNNKFLECPITAEDYFWYLDHEFLGINSRIINPESYGNGKYSVMISNDECKSDSSDEYSFSQTTGIQDVKNSDDITLYPNPNNGSFYVNLTKTDFTEGYLEIFNENGELLYNKQIPKDLKKIKINLSNQISGTCLLVYSGKSKSITKKFTVRTK